MEIHGSYSCLAGIHKMREVQISMGPLRRRGSNLLRLLTDELLTLCSSSPGKYSHGI